MARGESEAGKGDNVVPRTNYKKFYENYPEKWRKSDDDDG